MIKHHHIATDKVPPLRGREKFKWLSSASAESADSIPQRTHPGKLFIDNLRSRIFTMSYLFPFLHSLSALLPKGALSTKFQFHLNWKGANQGPVANRVDAGNKEGEPGPFVSLAHILCKTSWFICTFSPPVDSIAHTSRLHCLFLWFSLLVASWLLLGLSVRIEQFIPPTPRFSGTTIPPELAIPFNLFRVKRILDGFLFHLRLKTMTTTTALVVCWKTTAADFFPFCVVEEEEEEEESLT